MPKPSGLVRVNARWYFRQRVPSDIVEIIGKDELKFSLGTSDYNAALKLYDEKSAEVRSRFADARRQKNGLAPKFEDLSPQEVDQLGDVFLTKWLQRVADTEGLDAGEIKLNLRDAAADLALLQRRDAASRRKLAQIAAAVLRDAGYQLETSKTDVIRAADNGERNFDTTSDNYKRLLEQSYHMLEQISLATLGTHVDGLSPAVRHIPAMMGEKRSEPTLGAMIEKYRQYLLERENRPKTNFDYEPVFSIFSEVIGNGTPLSQISIGTCEPAIQLFKKLPPNPRKRFPGKTYVEIAKIAEQKKLPPVSLTTARKNIQAARTIFDWAKDMGMLTSNPVPKSVMPKSQHDEHSRSAILREDLPKVFSSDIFNRTDDGGFADDWAWLLLILLYHGVRLNEVCQLRVDQVAEREGILVFDLTDLAEDQRVKTSNAKRMVPVHPVLLQSGFGNFLRKLKQAGQTQLFPKCKRDSRGYYSNSASRWGNRFLQKVGVKTDKSIAMHSFRHSFRDGALRAGLSEDTIDKIGGWASQKVSSRYGSGTAAYVPQLFEQISKVKFGLKFEGE